MVSVATAQLCHCGSRTATKDTYTVGVALFQYLQKPMSQPHALEFADPSWKCLDLMYQHKNPLFQKKGDWASSRRDLLLWVYQEQDPDSVQRLVTGTPWDLSLVSGRPGFAFWLGNLHEAM